MLDMFRYRYYAGQWQVYGFSILSMIASPSFGEWFTLRPDTEIYITFESETLLRSAMACIPTTRVETLLRAE
jgi:hypothetical protein